MGTEAEVGTFGVGPTEGRLNGSLLAYEFTSLSCEEPNIFVFNSDGFSSSTIRMTHG